MAKCRHCQQLTDWVLGVARVGMFGAIATVKARVMPVIGSSVPGGA